MSNGISTVSSVLPFVSFSVLLFSYTSLTNGYLLILFAFILPHQVVHQLEVRMLIVPFPAPPPPPPPIIFVFHYVQLYVPFLYTQNLTHYIFPHAEIRGHKQIKRTLKIPRARFLSMKYSRWNYLLITWLDKAEI